MNGFFVLDVPEFRPLLRVAERAADCRIHAARAGYWFVEFTDKIVIRRSDLDMSEAVWFGCLTAGLSGRIVRFDAEAIELAATNEPIIGDGDLQKAGLL
jgi:hypothetical protein